MSKTVKITAIETMLRSHDMMGLKKKGDTSTYTAQSKAIFQALESRTKTVPFEEAITFIREILHASFVMFYGGKKLPNFKQKVWYDMAGSLVPLYRWA